MGLDAWIYKRGKNDNTKLLYSLEEGDFSKDEDGNMIKEVKYWRKHYAINQILIALAQQKDIDMDITEDWNCQEIILTKEDINRLLELIKNYDRNKLKLYSAYSNSNDVDTELNELNEVLEKIKKEIDFDNEEVFYYAWW